MRGRIFAAPESSKKLSFWGKQLEDTFLLCVDSDVGSFKVSGESGKDTMPGMTQL